MDLDTGYGQATVVNRLDLGELSAAKIHPVWLHIVSNGLGEPVRIPMLIGRGAKDGPTLGITAAIHGNELNGIRLIQRLFEKLDPLKLSGNIIATLVANVPGLLATTRNYPGGRDLNRIAPGSPHGAPDEVYINRYVERIITQVDYFIDLHTAGFGFINAHYVRADMKDEVTARLARLQNSDIILHNQPSDSTLRGAAEELGKKAVTVELRDSHVFQRDVINDGLVGIENLLKNLSMTEGEIVCRLEDSILVQSSRWFYSDAGGILTSPVELSQQVKKGDTVGTVRTIFGELMKRIETPEDGIVIAKTVTPIAPTGSRVVHIGYEQSVLPCISVEDATKPS